MNPKHVVLIVQARLGSTRLPGKVLKEVLKKPLLTYLIERLRRVRHADDLVIATTELSEDDAIVSLCNREAVSVVRGSSNDVLGRYAKAALTSQASQIVRICSDCPLIDPIAIDQAIEFYLKHFPSYDYVGNFLERRYPRGYEVEVFSREALVLANAQAIQEDEREHVTPYLYRNPQLFKIGSVVGECQLGDQRWVVDTAEDFELVSRILTELYPSKPYFHTDDIVELLIQHPDWTSLNAHIQQRQVKGFPGESHGKR